MVKITRGILFFNECSQATIMATPAAIPIDPPRKLKSIAAVNLTVPSVPDATITESLVLFF